MKELSIEEKAKAYDKAVINGSRLWECDKITREDYEYIFPALKESEDERIRENIIATIHLYYGEPLENEAKEMIAWLEKQGKNDMGISEATKQKLENNLNKALEKETPESFNKFLDEQKPADTEKGANGNEREIPNSAWSEEDERICYTIVNNIAIDKTICKYEISKGICNEQIDWLKSLKGRVQPQLKQEWSAKDEAMLLTIINRLELSKNGNASEIPYVKSCVDWLESLRPQIHWKPSDEQMEALVSAIDVMIDNRGAGDKKTILLSGLYHELKAL